MNKETRTIVYDDELQIEAYSLNGFVRAFPKHFHEYYVFGLIEGGKRLLSCKNEEYRLQKNDIVVFNPGDNHSCSPVGNESLDYRGINIPKETMLRITREITKESYLPSFSTNVIYDEEIANLLRSLHQLMITESHEFEKEEIFYFLISHLLHKYGMILKKELTNCAEDIEKACSYMEE
ncbi:MAG: AraC family ligand binding domain-containing protein, partial [Lachnospiraceae bacterium]|nr:AraC family ligand binding domain-containing protein [Lachnospiraceae bacterium]